MRGPGFFAWPRLATCTVRASAKSVTAAGSFFVTLIAGANLGAEHAVPRLFGQCSGIDRRRISARSTSSLQQTQFAEHGDEVGVFGVEIGTQARAGLNLRRPAQALEVISPTRLAARG